MTTYTADRKGHITENDSFQDRFLEKMYGSAIGRALLKPLVNPVLSEIGGRILDSRVSALAVPAFIRHAGIDMRDYEPKKYWSYNDFFTRQIREGAREIDMVPEANNYKGFIIISNVIKLTMIKRFELIILLTRHKAVQNRSVYPLQRWLLPDYG